MDPQELRRQRAKLIADARAILDTVGTEDRALTGEEEANYIRIMGDPAKDVRGEIDNLADQIKREESLQAEEEKLQRSQGHKTTPDPNDHGGGGDGDDPEKRSNPQQAERRAVFQKFLRSGPQFMTEPELRALQADSDVAGGYTVQDEEFSLQLIKAVDNLVFVRQAANVLPPLVKAESLGVPALDADPADADWTTELATGSEDSTMAFGKRSLTPHPFAKRIKVASKLLRASALNVEALVIERLAYKFSVTEEKGFLTGSGAGQPLGLFTASAQGISTGRDVSTGNLATSIQADGLMEAKWTLKPQYRQRAAWLFHSDALKQIAKLKDGDGQYIWKPGIAENVPDRLLNLPYMESQYAPNTFTASLYVGILGDFKNYWIVDALDMTVQRLVELYAEAHQVGFIGRAECDGMPVLEEAFVRVKLAA